MRNFLKKAVIVTCVFVATFMLTVIAFADFDVQNDNYKGTYYSDRSDGTIKVTDRDFKIWIYFDHDNCCFLTGSTSDGKLSNSAPDHFNAIFEKAYKVFSDGTYPEQYLSIPWYKASGDVSVKMGGLFNTKVKQVTITSKQSGYKYTLTN